MREECGPQRPRPEEENPAALCGRPDWAAPRAGEPPPERDEDDRDEDDRDDEDPEDVL